MTSISTNFSIRADKEYKRYWIKCSTGEAIPLASTGKPSGSVVLTFYKTDTEGAMTAVTAARADYELLGADGGPLYDDSLSTVSRLDITADLNSYAGRVSSVSVRMYDSSNVLLAQQSFGTVKDGEPGDPGSTGLGVKEVTEYYLATSKDGGVSTSMSEGWTTGFQQVSAAKKYLWNFERIDYTDNKTFHTTQPQIIGMYSKDGTNGKDGRGITGITEYYYVGSSGVIAPVIGSSEWKTTPQTMTAAKRYLWNYEEVHYTDGGIDRTSPVVIGVYGEKGDPGDSGHDGSDAVLSCGASIPMSAYADKISPRGMFLLLTKDGAPVDGTVNIRFIDEQGSTIREEAGKAVAADWGSSIATDDYNCRLWNYRRTEFTNGTVARTAPVLIADRRARGTIQTVTQYYLASASSTGVSTSTSGWSTSVQYPTSAKPYLWCRADVKYTDGTTANIQPERVATLPSGSAVRSVTQHYLATPQQQGVTYMSGGYDLTTGMTVCTSRLKKAPYSVLVEVLEPLRFDKTFGVSYESPAPFVRKETAWSSGLQFRNGDILLIDGKIDEGSVFSWRYPIAGNSTVDPETDVSNNAATTHWVSFDYFNMVATNLILAEQALLAGWVFRDNKLYSQNGTCMLDGVNGHISMAGTIRNIETHITKANYQQYMSDKTTYDGYSLDFLKIGSMIWIDDNLPLDGVFMLPAFTNFHGLIGDSYDEVRSYIGTKLYIYNNSPSASYEYTFGGALTSVYTRTNPGFNSIVLTPGEMGYFECLCGSSNNDTTGASGTEQVYWYFVRTKFKK